MADNPYTGETTILIGGKPHSLLFDFRALAKVHAECGPNAVKGFFDRDAIWQQSPEHVAKIVHAGLHRNHPEVTLDAVLDGLPFYAETIATLSKALVYAYFGVDAPEQGEASSEDTSKKN